MATGTACIHTVGWAVMFSDLLQKRQAHASGTFRIAELRVAQSTATIEAGEPSTATTMPLVTYALAIRAQSGARVAPGALNPGGLATRLNVLFASCDAPVQVV